MNTSFSVSIKDIYGTNDPEIPKGWEATEFRIVKEGEYFLGPQSRTVCQQIEFYVVANLVRIILRKKTERKYEKIISRCSQCPNYKFGLVGRLCDADHGRLLENGEGSLVVPDWCPLPKN